MDEQWIICFKYRIWILPSSYYQGIKVSIMVSIKAGAGLDRVGWIRSSMVRGKIRLT